MPASPDVWLACHGPLDCNSGHHVRALAAELARRDLRITVCVPERSKTDADLPATVAVRTFAEAVRAADVHPPRLLHLWTPRERMRRFHRDVVARHGAAVRLVVHLEDNESLLLAQQMRLDASEVDDVRDGLRPLDVPDHLTHPLLGRRLVAAADGVTALVAPLVEGLPGTAPVAVFHPGFDPIFAPARPTAAAAIRHRLEIPPECGLVAYTGNVHASNVDEVRSLYIAVALANRMGCPVRLIRTGVDHVPLTDHGAEVLHDHVHELGIVPRADLPDLVHAADLLVQPGRVDDWNRLRFPSKLPDYLVSGRPVILPRVNLGAKLEHGRQAIVLPEATAERIASALVDWLPRKDRLAPIGAAGADFARRELTWPSAADTVASLHRHVLGA